ncbi:restriction endonuclease subunit S [Escherichia coli]|uniref:restriction endonuclease subunit S n=1 Tax=Escherichia coli TaxID=562 RepID=UPI00157BC5E3|nr:restriction endonuclease subunit S [Escherichia coli]EEZ6659458.1 restriction endonuclease subunit S [Escherichia coli]EFB7244717.1 restriction endonuclease subunit S [Escherichia coli]MCH4633085.1 restriction endonuclease subunit S [Escherichia coli]NUD72729.1 restriction endonuclease subunit S [Escherichia coli]
MDFDEYSFADLLSNIVDNRGKTCPVEDKGFPLIATNCIKDDSLYPVFEKVRFVSDDTYKNWFRGHPNAGDIIFVCKGSPGRVAWVKEPVSFCIAQDMVAIRADQRLVDPMFLFSLLRSEQVINKINNMHVGTLIPHFKKGDFKNLYLSIPRNLKIQRAIGLFYFSLSEKIEKNKEINQTLEQMAQALFKSWFVNFEPVKAKMAVLEAGGSQEDATLAAMTAISGKNADALAVFEREHPEQYAELKATAELFPSAMQDSELGNIPVTWELGKLQDLLVLQRGFDLPSSARKDGEFPLIAASGPNGTHNVAMAKAPGVITGRSGVLGKVYLTLEDYWPLNTTLWVKEFKRATPCYAYELLRLLDMKAFNAGSAVPSLNRNHIHSLSYPLPPMALVNLFESSALLLHQRAHVNLKHSQSLALLRDTLLPKLLSGEITLPEAELAVSEAENV